MNNQKECQHSFFSTFLFFKGKQQQNAFASWKLTMNLIWLWIFVGLRFLFAVLFSFRLALQWKKKSIFFWCHKYSFFFSGQHILKLAYSSLFLPSLLRYSLWCHTVTNEVARSQPVNWMDAIMLFIFSFEICINLGWKGFEKCHFFLCGCARA